MRHVPISASRLRELESCKGANPIPEDFDEFWAKRMAEADAVDLDYEIVPSKIPTFDTCTYYDLWFAGMGGVTVLKPDAWAHTAAHGSKYEWYWFLEADLGTESRAAISRKADVYEAYRRTGLEQDRQHVFPKVVWLTPDQARTDRLDTLFAAEHLAAGHQAMTLDRFVGLVANHQPGDA